MRRSTDASSSGARARRGLWLFVAAVLAVAAAPARAYTVVDRAFSATDFATGFPAAGGIGPSGVAMSPSGILYVADAHDGFVYTFGAGGGIATPSRRLNARPIDHPVDLLFARDGRLYATQGGTHRDVVELDPATGAIRRTVASGFAGAGPGGLAQDPLSGDLFVSQFAVPPGGSVVRIANPAAAAPGVTTFASGLDFPDGLTFAGDGTLYVAENGRPNRVAAISGTGAATPGVVTTVAMFPAGSGPDAVVVGAGFLLVNRNDGRISKITLAGPTAPSDLLTGGTRGDIARVGGDGCAYATQSDRVIRIADADGSCSLVPAVSFDGPPIAMTRAASAIGGSSATLNGVVNPNGLATPVRFEIGPSASYGATTPAQSLSAGTAAVPVAAPVGGLLAGVAYHFRVVAANAKGASAGADQTFIAGVPNSSPPTVLRLKITPGSFRAAPSGPSATTAAARTRRKLGASVSYALDQTASVRFSVERTRPGRTTRSGRCAAPTRSNRHARACTRVIVLGSFRLSGLASGNAFRFSGRLAGRKLAPGRYRLVAAAVVHGLVGQPKAAAFRIIP